MLSSSYIPLGNAHFPPYQGRQHYMHSFDLAAPKMLPGFEDYAELVESLCVAAGAVWGEAHMTVDEKIVPAGMSQRRPGAHVDGCFRKETMDWSHGPRPRPGWLHYCNYLPVQRMAVIVAASVPGCKVYPGEFDGRPSPTGDLEHIREQLGNGILLPANQGFVLSPDCVHESVVFGEATRRQFLRIALPV